MVCLLVFAAEQVPVKIILRVSLATRAQISLHKGVAVRSKQQVEVVELDLIWTHVPEHCPNQHITADNADSII